MASREHELPGRAAWPTYAEIQVEAEVQNGMSVDAGYAGREVDVEVGVRQVDKDKQAVLEQRALRLSIGQQSVGVVAQYR